jgi:hypothetical protein
VLEHRLVAGGDEVDDRLRLEVEPGQLRDRRRLDLHRLGAFQFVLLQRGNVARVVPQPGMLRHFRHRPL